jgi:hypothetical protein
MLPAGWPTVTSEINVVTPGMIRLKFNSTKGLGLSIDNQPVEIKDVLDLDLKLGFHVIKLEIGGSRKDGEGIRIEVEESPGSAGRVQVVGGK